MNSKKPSGTTELFNDEIRCFTRKMNIYYHNPRCSKSRAGLNILETAKETFQVKKYLQEKLTKEELTTLLKKLKKTPREIMRKKEPLYQELDVDGQQLEPAEEIELLIKYPQLLERPIYATAKSAVIGRPPELIKNLLK